MPQIYQQVAVVGVGLMGGSIGLALRENALAAEVVGIGRRQASLDKAIRRGAISRGTLELEEGVSDAEMVVVATPVASVANDVCRVLAAAPGGSLVTDVASTKATICAEVERRLPDNRGFVGSHPLAGDHRCGPENARGDMFAGSTVVVTPTENTAADAISRAQAFWESLGATVVPMAPDRHDQALAATSHLPHLVASALAAATPDEWLSLVATGWCDTTRIAASDPDLWTQIFTQNKPAVGQALEQLIARLQEVESKLAADDWAAIRDFMQQAKRIRDAVGD